MYIVRVLGHHNNFLYKIVKKKQNIKNQRQTMIYSEITKSRELST